VSILNGVFMENKSKNVSRPSTAETLSDTVIAVLDKLAGKQSDLKLSFEDLTLDLGMMKARVNGAVVLDVVYASEAEPKVSA
jgi:hypothetical protein